MRAGRDIISKHGIVAGSIRPTRVMRSRPSFRLAFWGTVMLGASYGAAVGLEALSNGPLMAVHSVVVRGADGASELDDDRQQEIANYAAVPLGSPILGVDLDAIEGRAAAHPLIHEVHAQRRLPNQIVLDIALREAAGIVQAGTLYIVDSEGRAFKEARLGDVLNRPVISGIDADEILQESGRARIRSAMAMLDRLQTHLSDEVSELICHGDDDYTFVLVSGTRIRSGAHPESKRLAMLGRVLQQSQSKGLDVDTLFLTERGPERVSFRVGVTPEMGDVNKTKTARAANIGHAVRAGALEESSWQN